MTDRPLSGVRVVDMTRLLPGPYASLLLADMGADVIKVERIGGSDLVRNLPPKKKRMSAFYIGLNRNKRSIALNLDKREEAVKVLEKLIASADVFLEGFRPGSLERYGLSIERLHELNPRLVICSITGYGQSGPFRDKAGHDINYQAEAGALSLAGEVDGVPPLPALPIADLGGGALFGVIRIIAALYERDRTGKGAHLDVAIAESMLSLEILGMARLAVEGRTLTPGDYYLSGGLASYGVYRTKDGGTMALGILEEKFWRRFCLAVGRPDLLMYRPLDTGQADGLKDLLVTLFGERTTDEWEALAAENDICLSKVRDLKEALAHPHFTARGLVHETMHPDEGKFFHIKTPVSDMSSMEASIPAPKAGQHSQDILEELGYDADERKALKDSDAVG